MSKNIEDITKKQQDILDAFSALAIKMVDYSLTTKFIKYDDYYEVEVDLNQEAPDGINRIAENLSEFFNSVGKR